jgi:glycosyltransferase involved in cell wall biosynthesis
LTTKKISVVTPCFNELLNLNELVSRVQTAMAKLPYEYEHIFIDNCSTDGTVDRLRALAASNKNIKVILNTRNFGTITSTYHGILQSRADACIMLASDLQDPPEIIPALIKQWESGYKVVLAVKPDSLENKLRSAMRKAFYRLLNWISDVPLVNDATGAGLYDRRVLEVLRSIKDPYPYFRGLLSEIGYPIGTVAFVQPLRSNGQSKSRFYTLLNEALLGITKHSRLPLRLLTILGIFSSILSFLIGLGYLCAKLIFWDSFQIGTAPLLIGFFMMAGIQMLGFGLIGEYLGLTLTHIRNMPLVIELERINFEDEGN